MTYMCTGQAFISPLDNRTLHLYDFENLMQFLTFSVLVDRILDP